MDTTQLRNEVFQMIEEQILHDYMRCGQVSYQRAKELTDQTAIMQKVREIEKHEKQTND